jgi:hypothetical protein
MLDQDPQCRPEMKHGLILKNDFENILSFLDVGHAGNVEIAIRILKILVVHLVQRRIVIVRGLFIMNLVHGFS